ncbi:MAG: PASTA domain-containing protein, partial [Actinomycetaceae bacterium]|nr:PASTA domain-containing protein [Actinomycetaceae bacterium]
YSDTMKAGFVVSTNPANTRLRLGSTVVMIVSLGVETVEVPDVVSLDRDEAVKKIKAARLFPKVSEAYSDDVEKDLVVSQSVEGGAVVNHDSTVEIIVSLGREPVEVPSVAAMHRDDAVQTLEAAGLNVDVIEEASSNIPAGTVISQEQPEGTVYRGDTVKITVSKGPPTVAVPDVRNLSAEDARARLEAAGLKVKEEKWWLGTQVRKQVPNPGTNVQIGSTVKIIIR